MDVDHELLVSNLFARLLGDTVHGEPAVGLTRLKDCLEAALMQEPAPCPEGERLFRARVMQGIPPALKGVERLQVLTALLARINASLVAA